MRRLRAAIKIQRMFRCWLATRCLHGGRAEEEESLAMIRRLQLEEAQRRQVEVRIASRSQMPPLLIIKPEELDSGSGGGGSS